MQAKLQSINTRKAGLKLIAYLAGLAVFIFSLYFLGRMARTYWHDIRAYDLTSIRYGDLAVALGLCFVANILVSLVWPILLKRLANTSTLLKLPAESSELPFRIAIPIGLLSQIGKYMPGNAAHYLGRAALAKRHGVAIQTSIATTGLEFLAAIFAGGVIFTACLLLDESSYETAESIARDAGVSSRWFLVSFVALMVFIMFAGLWICVSDSRRRMAMAALSPLLILSFAFLAVGTSFLFVLRCLDVDIGREGMFATINMLFVIAWIAGFLVPGAPAGLGVREALLVATLSTVLAPELTILAGLIHRLVAIFADVVTATVSGIFLSYGEARLD